MSTLVERTIDNGDGTFTRMANATETPTPRPVVIVNGVSVAGATTVLPPDPHRTSLVVRNDDDVAMYFRTDGEAGSHVGYPLDARRGFSFESVGLLPSDPISLWCGEAGRHWVVMYSTDGDDA